MSPSNFAGGKVDTVVYLRWRQIHSRSPNVTGKAGDTGAYPFRRGRTHGAHVGRRRLMVRDNGSFALTGPRFFIMENRR
jgi:hypothetical protein